MTTTLPAAHAALIPDPVSGVGVRVTLSRRVVCAGGGEGHPRVYLALGTNGAVACPYCGQRFVLGHQDEGVVGPDLESGLATK